MFELPIQPKLHRASPGVCLSGAAPAVRERKFLGWPAFGIFLGPKQNRGSIGAAGGETCSDRTGRRSRPYDEQETTHRHCRLKSSCTCLALLAPDNAACSDSYPKRPCKGRRFLKGPML